MAHKISVTVAEQAALVAAEVMMDGDHEQRKNHKAIVGLLAKLDAAALPKKSAGLSGLVISTVAREVLGKRLLLPVNGNAPVWGEIVRGVARLALTEEQLATAARAAGERWKGQIKLESIVRQAGALLSDDPAPAASGSVDDWEDIEVGED